jgi:hypothetical protein
MVMILYQITVTQCADRGQHSWFQVTVIRPAYGFSNDSLFVVECHIHEQCLLKRAS